MPLGHTGKMPVPHTEKPVPHFLADSHMISLSIPPPGNFVPPGEGGDT
jgi:hypothetical protein